MDRTEKLTITRGLSSTVVKLVVTESGITVNYSVKTYEHNLAESIKHAREGCNRFLKLAQDSSNEDI